MCLSVFDDNLFVTVFNSLVVIVIGHLQLALFKLFLLTTFINDYAQGGATEISGQVQLTLGRK